VLVAAVLGPEQREHRELEIVREAAEQVADTVELAVGKPEAAMEWFRDRAQGGSVSAASDGSYPNLTRGASGSLEHKDDA
jgi:hypothetical protein